MIRSLIVTAALLVSIVGASAQDIDLRAEVLYLDGVAIDVKSDAYYNGLVDKCMERIKPYVDAKECAADINHLRRLWKSFVSARKYASLAQINSNPQAEAEGLEKARAALKLIERNMPYLRRGFGDIFIK